MISNFIRYLIIILKILTFSFLNKHTWFIWLRLKNLIFRFFIFFSLLWYHLPELLLILIFFNLVLVVKLFEPAIEIPHNVFRSNSWCSLKFSVNSVFVNLNNRIQHFWFQNVQSYNFNCIYFLINVVHRSIHFPESSLAYLHYVLELFL